MYDVCVDADAGIPFACKAGACGTCATEVLDGEDGLNPKSAREVRTLEANGLDPERYRLPCLCDVNADVTFGKSAHAVDATETEADVRLGLGDTRDDFQLGSASAQ